MDLLDAYTEQIKYSNGIYSISAVDMTMEQIHMLANQWGARFGDKKALLIMPDDRNIFHANEFDFGIAFRMMKSGWKVTTKSEPNFYLYYDKEVKKIMEQILPEGPYAPTEYIPDQEDLLKTDWIIYR